MKTGTTSVLGKIVLENEIIDGTITVTDEKIVNVQKGFDTTLPNTLDYKNSYILPGLIEVHGHLREPGLEHKEDIPHGTRAALAGGVTTVLDMPNTKPPTTTVELVNEKIELYEKKSYTDYGINMGVSADNISEIEKIDPKKITAVKIFTAGHANTPTTIPDLGDIARIFEILGKRNIMAIVHAENQQLVNYFTEKYKEKTKPSTWSDARNQSVVLTATLEMIALAKQFNVKLYLLHLSTADEFAAVKFGNEIGVKTFGETVTYQLAFNTSDYEKYGNLINVAPALRAPDEQKKLWELLRAGKIDTVVSEHTPHTLDEKKGKWWEVFSGMPELQESLPVLITHWVKHFGSDTLEEGLMKLAQTTSINIAKIFSLNDKGGIKAGKDADFTIIDTENKWTVKKEELFTKCGWSAYEGETLIGRPTATFLRGNIVYENGKIVGEQGQGKIVTVFA